MKFTDLYRLAANSFNSVKSIGNEFGFVFQIGEDFCSFLDVQLVGVVARNWRVDDDVHGSLARDWRAETRRNELERVRKWETVICYLDKLSFDIWVHVQNLHVSRSEATFAHVTL